MQRAPVTVLASVVLVLAAGGLVSTPGRAKTPPPPLVIGVDNATPNPCPGAPPSTEPPACHDFEYTDYFPNRGVAVHDGDLIDFRMNPGSPDGFHTATLLKLGDTWQTAFTSLPFATPDADPGDTPGQLEVNPRIVRPTATCGTAAQPCVYDGTAEVNSGALFNAAPGTPKAEFFDRIELPSGTALPRTVTFICRLHPGMQGSLTVVDDDTPASTQGQLDALAQTQYQRETADALAAESTANTAGRMANADGTTTWTLAAGVDGANQDAHVQVLEMLPSTLSVKPGDAVRWSSPSTMEIHTVSFPAGSGSDPIDPFPVGCEAGTGDTPGNLGAGAPSFGCSTAAQAEIHYSPRPAGATLVTQPGAAPSPTLTTSGILALAGVLGTFYRTDLASYTYLFPGSSGTFSYQCRVHDSMRGTIVEATAAVAPVPNRPTGAATAPRTGVGGLPAARASILALLGAGLLLAGRRLRRRCA